METAVLPTEERWNLHDLYADDDAFERAKQEFRDRRLDSLEPLRGRLGESGTVLADALERATEARRQLSRIHCYAALFADQDVRVAGNQSRRQEVELLGTEFSQRTAFLRPEILALQPERVEGYLKDEPRLVPFADFLNDLLRLRDHVLGPSEEGIVAESGLLSRGAASLYQLFTGAELPRPEVELSTGEQVRLTPVNFQKHRTTAHRPDRQKLFSEYFSAYAAFRETFGQNLTQQLKTHLFHARVRRYPGCLAAALAPDNVPESVYLNLIKQVRAQLPLLFRYFRMRAKKLGLERLDYADLYCPLGSAPPARYTTEQSRRLLQEGLQPLGDEYITALERSFASRWIDWHPGEGKRAGAYVMGWAYDVHPYVLLNFNGDYESVSTLAHEMGHALHSHFSNAAQPYATADYSIFVAEVASTFNESLLLQKTLEAATADDERLALVGSYIDGMRGTLFRQTMFAEFELEIHRRTENGEVLTGERLSEIYLALLRDYHGHDEGVVHVADDYGVEWAAIPHMYYNFYVYQYATGIVAATALARAVSTGQPGARERYLDFLRSGGSDYPLELLQRAGVDLQSAKPYTETFAALQHHLDLLEGWLDTAAR